MRAAGAADVAIRVFTHYYRLLESGSAGHDPRGRHRAGRRPAAPGPPGHRRRGDAGRTGRDGGDQAQRRPRYVDGRHRPEVRTAGQGRAELPRHHRPPDPQHPAEVRRTAAAGADELLPHQGGVPADPERVRRPRGRRPAAGLHAEHGAEAARRGPDPGRVGAGPGAGLVPAGSRRPVHRVGCLRHPRRAAGTRFPARVHLERGQPRRDPGRPDRGLDGRARRTVRDGGLPADPVRPQGRARRGAQVRRPADPAGQRAGRRRGHQVLPGHHAAHGPSTPTTCGSTWTGWPS